MTGKIIPEKEKNDAKVYVGRTLRVFISYSALDKSIAGLIKDSLEFYGLEAFLAHEDINPADEWLDVVIDNLESADLFLPVITKNFMNSDWTDQESGIAFNKNKLIIPISVDNIMPYGFISRFQALKLSSSSIDEEEFYNKIVEVVIRKRPNFEIQVLDSFINAFASSTSWIDAGLRAKQLLNYKKVTFDQFVKVINAAGNNSQIYNSIKAKPYLETLKEKYSSWYNQIKLTEKSNLEVTDDPFPF